MRVLDGPSLTMGPSQEPIVTLRLESSCELTLPTCAGRLSPVTMEEFIIKLGIGLVVMVPTLIAQFIAEPGQSS